MGIAKVVAALNRTADLGFTAGLDTEFYGVQVGKQSCVARARVHIWSVAVPRWPVVISPRGTPICDAAVLGSGALLEPGIIHWLTSNAPKFVHNLPVDAHAFGNMGINLGGGLNTLALARWAWPERARGAGFTLDALGRDFLGIGKMSEFKEVFSEEITEYNVRTKRISYCECGANPCRKRVTSPGHRRLERLEETRIPKQVVREIPLESVGPDHPRWEPALDYAAQDAVLAHGVGTLALRTMEGKKVDVPWLPRISAHIGPL